MNQLDILVPFGLPPPELAKDLLRQCNTPSLALLLARAKNLQSESFDAFAPALPHEAWLARKFLPERSHSQSSPPLADALMRQHGLQAESGTWFVVQPVHFHIARDHLVLTDPRQLALSDDESRQLFEAARQLFEESGMNLVYGDAVTWFVQADDWQDLHTATPDAACGHNIDIWLPKGQAELAWRKLQNEVQMHWHTHDVNADREMRGAKPVNSLWLWGGTAVPHGAHCLQHSFSYTDTFRLDSWSAAQGASGVRNHGECRAADVILAQPERGLLLLDDLLAPGLAGDWGTWLQQWHMLDAEWFGPFVSALQGGRLQHVDLILTHNCALAEFGAGRGSLRKFWVKPSLHRLLP